MPAAKVRTPAGKHGSRDRGRKGGTPAAADDGRRRGAGTAGAVRGGRAGEGRRRALKQQELYVPQCLYGSSVQCPLKLAGTHGEGEFFYFNLFLTIFKINNGCFFYF